MHKAETLDPRCASIRNARSDDLAAVRTLLERAGLPTAGVEAWLPHFLVAEHAGDVVAVAGLELYESSALLRSVAVRPDWQGSGLGRQLVDRLLTKAQEGGTRDVYLLTTTADHYFPRLGFACIGREDVPACVQGSVEFTRACPASAVAMRKSLVDAGGPAG
ncbi:MAG TPA: arsenic resistance N-acetyltransferase ArsN2 [Gemmatimonadales bacterium]|nr:arsenic resistance N-acetyltransferase ArsN2 [Gemmatimonadales bacterium]